MDKRLSTVQVPLKKASVLQPEVLPLFKGQEDDNLLCGGCEAVLAQGVSEQTLVTRIRGSAELLVQCPRCSAFNEFSDPFIPTQP